MALAVMAALVAVVRAAPPAEVQVASLVVAELVAPPAAARAASPADAAVGMAESAAAVVAAMRGGCRRSVEIEHRKSPSLPPHALAPGKSPRPSLTGGGP